MNSNNRNRDSSGLIVVLFVLLNSLVLREAYTGCPQWSLVHILTLPLLLFYVFKMCIPAKSKKQQMRKRCFFGWINKCSRSR